MLKNNKKPSNWHKNVKKCRMKVAYPSKDAPESLVSEKYRFIRVMMYMKAFGSEKQKWDVTKTHLVSIRILSPKNTFFVYQRYE